MIASTVKIGTSNANVGQFGQDFDIADLVEKHGNFLFRFAMKYVRDEFVAEDMVQETFLSAIKSLKRFSHKSSIQTWLTSILKNKVFDHFRKTDRELVVDSSDASNEEYFQPDGSWNPKFLPSNWGQNPASVVENQEFWNIINKGLLGLPKKTAEAFVLHEIEGTKTEEVCQKLKISKNNLWVMLHRARLHMQNVIDSDFFEF
jgi:RNA polymerase sigma-70 factor (ECF subfamily)